MGQAELALLMLICYCFSTVKVEVRLYVFVILGFLVTSVLLGAIWIDEGVCSRLGEVSTLIVCGIMCKLMYQVSGIARTGSPVLQVSVG